MKRNILAILACGALMATAAASGKTVQGEMGGVKVPISSGFKKGAKVQVLWHNKWYNATIIEIKAPKFKVHFTKFSDAWDTWTTSDKIRKMPTAKTKAAV
jgi:hypothetical protein